jgi:5-methylcytosine-specific restriction endonuclease McrA
MSTAWRGGSTRSWRKVRAGVLLRDGHACQLAIDGTCTGRATTVHHVLGKAMGDDPAHLVASCAPCNLKVGDPRGAADPPPTRSTRW